MSYGGSGGGSGRISSAADAALNNPADKDVLAYNSLTQKWTNSPASSVMPASGGSDTYATNQQSGTAYTLVLSDTNKVIENTGQNALTVTVPTNASVAFPLGTTVELLNYSTGSIVLTGATGVALRSVAGLRLTGQYAPAAIRKRAADEWIVTGATVV